MLKSDESEGDEAESKTVDVKTKQKGNAKLLSILKTVKMSSHLDISEISACVLVDTSEMRLGVVARVLKLKGRLSNADGAFTIKCGECS